MPKVRDTEGAIRQRPNGIWEARYTAGYDAKGKQVQKSIYGKDAKTVKRKLHAALVDVERNAIGTATGSVGEWLDTWLTDYKLRSVHPRTFSQYRRIVDTLIKPRIGTMRLQTIKVANIQRLINSLQDDGARKDTRDGGLSTAYITKIRNILHSAFDQAVINGEINRNPVTGVKLPKEDDKDIRVLSVDEQTRFITALDGDPLRPLFLLALATGMRRGELLGLTWDCIDLKKKVITVRQSATRYKDPVSGKPIHTLTNPKTFSSKRKIPLVDSMVPILKKHMNEQRMLAVSPQWNPLNLVFCSSRGTIIESATVNRVLDRIIKYAELERFSMHSLRHTFATRMLEAGSPAKVVQELLGHTDVTLTLNTYSHVMPEMAHHEIARINDMISLDSGTKGNKHKSKNKRER